MSVTATPSAAKLMLGYEDDGSYAMSKINTEASAEALLKTARGISVFQEGDLKDVCSYLDCILEKD